MTKMPALRPCPFCGGEAYRIDIPAEDDIDNAGGSCIQCRTCAASSALYFDRKENMESDWNRRREPVHVEHVLTSAQMWFRDNDKGHYDLYKAVERFMDIEC